jgi:hypothetical protein
MTKRTDAGEQKIQIKTAQIEKLPNDRRSHVHAEIEMTQRTAPFDHDKGQLNW